MSKIYLLGTKHGSKESKKQISTILSQYSFDIFLLEGIGSKNFKHVLKLKYFYVLPGAFLWRILLKLLGNEFAEIEKYAQDNNIKMKIIDLSIDELIQYYHRWYQGIIFIFVFSVLFFVFNINLSIYFNIYGSLISSTIFTFGIIFCLFIQKTMKIRDDEFYNNIEKIYKSGKYKSIFVGCGEEHTKAIKKSFDVIEL